MATVILDMTGWPLNWAGLNVHAFADRTAPSVRDGMSRRTSMSITSPFSDIRTSMTTVPQAVLEIGGVTSLTDKASAGWN
jgi:outer membrane receptor for monomeric catechols